MFSTRTSERKSVKRKTHKVHKCDVCNQGFTRTSHLVQHKRTHTGENLMDVIFVIKNLHK